MCVAAYWGLAYMVGWTDTELYAGSRRLLTYSRKKGDFSATEQAASRGTEMTETGKKKATADELNNFRKKVTKLSLLYFYMGPEAAGEMLILVSFILFQYFEGFRPAS